MRPRCRWLTGSCRQCRPHHHTTLPVNRFRQRPDLKSDSFASPRAGHPRPFIVDDHHALNQRRHSLKPDLQFGIILRFSKLLATLCSRFEAFFRGNFNETAPRSFAAPSSRDVGLMALRARRALILAIVSNVARRGSAFHKWSKSPGKTCDFRRRAVSDAMARAAPRRSVPRAVRARPRR